jgi:segregation and condensation protein B
MDGADISLQAFIWRRRSCLPACADRCVILIEIGDTWLFRAAQDLAPKLRTALTETRCLPRVAMETLVIIRLHQPITRAEIEHLRGVSLSQQSMDVLLDGDRLDPALGTQGTHGWLTLRVTTPQFSAQFRFGLKSLRDISGADLFSSWRGPVSNFLGHFSSPA